MGMSCTQAHKVRAEKARSCRHPAMRTTKTELLFTCHFGQWTMKDDISRRGPFHDHIDISKNDGRIWERYDSPP